MKNYQQTYFNKSNKWEGTTDSFSSFWKEQQNSMVENEESSSIMDWNAEYPLIWTEFKQDSDEKFII